MVTSKGRDLLQRLGALALALLVIPLLLSISSLLQDRPIRLGEESPRTVVAPNAITGIPDPEATERARRDAAAAVSPVLVDDDEAKAAIVQDVRDAFARVRAAREAGPDEQRPSVEEQVAALGERLEMLDEEALRLLVGLTDEQLSQVSTEAIQIAQQLARQRIRDDQVERVLSEQLTTELAVRPFPGEVASTVVDPIIRSAARPTVAVDAAATADARRQAAAEVAEVERSFTGGSVIVSAGEVVDEMQMAALRRRGLEGADPWRTLATAALLMVVLTVAVAGYLRAYRTQIWKISRRLVLLALLVTLFTLALELVTFYAPSGSAWLYVIPVGAIAMLATILFDPPIGVLLTIPVTVLVAFTTPGDPGVIAFAALASLFSVPLVSRLSARGDLRRAGWQSTLGYMALAGAIAAVFGEPGQIPTALAAGFINGIGTAIIVNGSLPFMESMFGVVTATSLLDLADRNHPLLRELEQKALGSYNHSIMVSTLVQRAVRAAGGDSLLGSVAALYHDIGKVRRPYFFVENQFGIANPHDELEPRVSAVIIQEHVTDGIEMARTFRLPPEVVEGIATHHGTTLVSYFYRQAVNAAGNGEQVDPEPFRYKGRKPASKEMAILMLADSCEAASRAAAQNNRNLTRDDLEGIVRGLVADRVEDGQLEESALTFRELKVVQDSFIETLVGVYHPRIAYPEGKEPAAPEADEAPARVE
jgi:cyclic-di-AMP phosphodiesterase PgpH